MIKINTLISKFLNTISLWGKFLHIYRVRQSKKIIKKIIAITKEDYGHAKAINYLRKINPYVFEEVILTCIENNNIRIIRNKSYSGDGGIDGVFKLKNGKVLVQCKRYGNYINAKDVDKLSYEVNTKKYFYGIFVHTGKTGDKSKNIVKEKNNVLFISGSLLINLIIGELNIESYINKKAIK